LRFADVAGDGTGDIPSLATGDNTAAV